MNHPPHPTPTSDGLATTLHVTADHLIFDTDERGPDDDLRLAFEATNNLNPEDEAHIQALLGGILLRPPTEHDQAGYAHVSTVPSSG